MKMNRRTFTCLKNILRRYGGLSPFMSVWLLCVAAFAIVFHGAAFAAAADYSEKGGHSAISGPLFDSFLAYPPIHIYRSMDAAPQGVSPNIIRSAYHLPASGGTGTIALIEAYKDASMENDLSVFDKKFNITPCTRANACLKIHAIGMPPVSASGWALETSLDVEWAHAIAPSAKILVVEARSTALKDLLSAIDYARAEPDVVAISLSWGGKEFNDEVSLDDHFTSKYGAAFFVSSGDNGAGVSWPAASPNVVSVGGTTLTFDVKGLFAGESAWSGSGGGESAYEKEPSYQNLYVHRARSMRAVPDVSYNADPAAGFSVYSSKAGRSKGWYVVGGTSAGAPQWAAIQALGRSSGRNISNEKLYADKSFARSADYFRDIVSGSNGDCPYYCVARKHYDYVTGLGSPLTFKF